MNKKLIGATLALTAAALFTAGHVAKADAKKEAGKVKCAGMNGCKSKGDCSGAKQGCKGKNECKGKGWNFVTSAEECTKKGGKVAK